MKRRTVSRALPPWLDHDVKGHMEHSDGLAGHAMYTQLSQCQQWLSKQQKPLSSITRTKPLLLMPTEEVPSMTRGLQGTLWYDELPSISATQWFQCTCSLCKKPLLLSTCQPWYHAQINSKWLLVCPQCSQVTQLN